jgi:hypothetical protein
MISFCGTAHAVWVSAFMASSGGGGYCWAGGEDNPAARGGGENYCEEISDERAPSRNSWKRPVPKRPGSLQGPPSAHWVPESAVDGGTLQILMAFGDAASDWSPGSLWPTYSRLSGYISGACCLGCPVCAGCPVSCRSFSYTGPGNLTEGTRTIVSLAERWICLAMSAILAVVICLRMVRVPNGGQLRFT